MPRNDTCDHPNCYGLPCKQLTPEELEPEPRDYELAEQLVAEGWVQTSRKYRMIARLKPEFPLFDELLHPLPGADKLLIKEIRNRWEDIRRTMLSYNDYTEIRELTVKQFTAFRVVAERVRSWGGATALPREGGG